MKHSVSRGCVFLFALLCSACLSEEGNLQLRESPPDLGIDTWDGQDSDSSPAQPVDACEGVIASISPEDGETQVAVGRLPTVTFAEGVDPMARGYTVRLRDVEEDVPSDVPSNIDATSNVLTVLPLGVVQAGRRYELRIDGSCGTKVTSFTTSAPAWRIELSSGTLTESTGKLGATDRATLLSKFGSALLGLEGASFSDVAVGLGRIDAGDQDVCAATLSGTATRSDASSVRINTSAGDIAFDGHAVAAGTARFEVSLDASSDRAFSFGALNFMLTANTVAGALGKNATDLCKGADNPCVPCSLAGSNQCVRFQIDGLSVNTTSVDYHRIPVGQVSANPTCPGR